MANWAKAQEDTTDLPVFKRARYGIHFQRPDGQIEAVFSGKPCHHFEGNEWKPIDTGLVIGKDGWYGAPHSDIKIHPDGRVRIDKSDYQQFTELPSAKAGRLAGDRIIKDFPGGEQHLVMKEDGFREEIHVFKPTFPIEKFIAKTTGNLPSKYRAHPITAEDAEGNHYAFTGDVKEFGDWLDRAVYPVVIDPDFSGGSGDGYVTGDNASYTTARETATFSRYTGNVEWIGQLFNTIYYVGRILLQFDTSSIDDSATVSQVNLTLTRTDTNNIDNAFDLQIVKHDWSQQSTADARYDACLSGTADDSIMWSSSSGWSANTQKTSGNLSAAWINKTGITYYSLRSSRDYAGLSPGSSGTIRERVYIALSENSTAAYRPILTVLYSSGGIPKHFMYYQRLRSL